MRAEPSACQLGLHDAWPAGARLAALRTAPNAHGHHCAHAPLPPLSPWSQSRARLL